MKLMILSAILLSICIVSVTTPTAIAQLQPDPDRPIIIGKPDQPIDCKFDNQLRCEPNKRVVIFAIFDDERNGADARGLESLLNREINAKRPNVVEAPLERVINNDKQFVITSLEFPNDEAQSIEDIKFEIGRLRVLDNADYLRITTFNTWHHFGDEHLKPCEIIDVIEVGSLEPFTP